jgi:hypothetical protein
MLLSRDREGAVLPYFSRCLKCLCSLLLLALTSSAHEGTTANRKPTQAHKDLDRAKKLMREAKTKLVSAGKYACCARPSCDSCARARGRCECAANLKSGHGVCGECYARLLTQGESDQKLKMQPTLAGEPQHLHEASEELREELAALTRAKRTLAQEKRYSCCIRGGCGQCAHEADCPCGPDLASTAGKKKGVCGECADGWRSGKGAFAGVPLSDVTVAVMPSTAGSMSPTAAESSGWYASGTSQAPAAAPMNMLHGRFKGWSLMVQGQAFAVYTNQTGTRGRDKLFAPNWIMPMAARRLGRGVLTLRSMLSFEPATITNRRYPLLLQTGETAYGIPVINGQHPHDFFMELGASYHLPFGERTAINLYGGPRGEPALGPTAFPHRVSSSENPIAVLAHHYQDSTHIATNVVTAGLTHGPVTIEASGFHGREPDEHRWGIEGGTIDSFSARATVNPTSRWSGQFSIGRINNRENLHPLRDTFRLSASATYVQPLARGHWAASLIWGRSHDLAYTQPPTSPESIALPLKTSARTTLVLPPPPIVPKHFVSVPTRVPGQIYNSYIAESTAKLADRHWIWGRIENTDKDSLLLFEEEPFALLVEERRLARVQAYTAGYAWELPRVSPWISQSLGGQVTLFGVPKALAPVYGDRPVGLQIFLRFRLQR